MSLQSRLPTLATLLLATSMLAQPAPAQQGGIESVQPMASNADPAFEVATIRPTDPSDQGQGFHLNGHRVHIENIPVLNMICFAYKLQNSQVVNAPKWLDEARWDVDGVPDQPGIPSNKQYQLMVQKLLADRFHLQFHREQRELPVYELTVLKSGSRLTPSKSAPDDGIDQTGHIGRGQQYMRYTNNNMQDFVEGLEYIVSRPVVNDTGLTGRYDFLLRWSNEMQDSTPNSAPGLFTAIQEQLGLKLVPTKAPVDVLVIDHVAQPSAN